MDRSTQEFIKALKIYKDILPKQTLKTLRGQALSGDLIGAKKGLDYLLQEFFTQSCKIKIPIIACPNSPILQTTI